LTHHLALVRQSSNTQAQVPSPLALLALLNFFVLVVVVLAFHQVVVWVALVAALAGITTAQPLIFLLELIKLPLLLEERLPLLVQKTVFWVVTD
jgi:hypothetical protein